MADATERTYKKALGERMKSAREAKGFTQEHVADLLGITKERYTKQEQRGALPAYLMERFAVVTGADPLWLLTGRTPRKDRRSPAAARARNHAG